MNENEKKIRIPLWIYPSTESKLNDVYQNDNCKSPSEFIEKAILFYIGFLHSENNIDYFSTAITRTVGGIVTNTENRISRLQFKIAVELAKLSKLLAMGYEFTDEQMKQIHYECVQEVKSTNGIIRLDLPSSK